MTDILDKGYAEEVPMNKISTAPGRSWYIPHHGVYHPRKPDKIRVVYDCAASYQGISLNSMLLQGPNLTSSLLDILLRFRQEPTAIMADIESMYYQVRVPPEDCDFLRFLWWPDGDYTQEPKIYRMLVHLFGATSSASCASFALQQTVRDNIDKYEPEVTDMIQSSFYVDDFLSSKEAVEETPQVVEDITNLCKDGGFRLTKWTSNSHEVMRSIPVEERAKNIKNLDLNYDELPNERALGVFWSVQGDVLSFSYHHEDLPNTRRGILSTVSRIYDPLGMVAPFVLIAKILLQNLCRKYGWDQTIEHQYLSTWRTWLAGLPRLEEISLPRCDTPPEFGEVQDRQLHVFSDASDKGYGVVVYTRLVNKRGEIYCIFVLSKAPLKKATVPRMELTAATVATKLAHMVSDAIKYDKTRITYWTDSTSVLRYIANESSRFQTFVANRVNVIREGSHISQWNYVPTKENPADIVSRGMKLEDLLSSPTWFHGPDFLQKTELYWPQQPEGIAVIQDSDPEVKKNINATVMKDERKDESSDVMDRLMNHYSNWTKLRRAVGWILLLIEKLKTKSRKQRDEIKPYLTVEILDQAEVTLIRITQQKNLKQELKIIQDKETQEIKKSRKIRKSSTLSKLNPFIEDGILRVGGRVANAEIPYDAKYPIILPKDSPISRLLLDHVHREVGHLGRNVMLSQLRQKYWIIGASTAVRRVVSRCITCRKYQSKPCEQKMAELPPDRLMSDVPPFTNVGMDYFGLFTCLNIRAVHLELANSLDTDSCINAIRRFISRRGPPKLIRSDNGTNFIGSERELRDELKKMNTEKMGNAMMNKGIEWIFNPPAASHFGGVWERMIRSVRKILFSLSKEQNIKLDDEGLYTLLCEVEAVLNGRPLTEVSLSPHDTAPLTPNHLLLCRPGEAMPTGVFSKDDTYCRRRWRQVQYLADIFWKRWIKEYLPVLQERQKWNRNRRNLMTGDVVLLTDRTPRNTWSLGRVIETMKDRKGFVRVAKVKTSTTELVRPIDRMCLIVASDEHDE